MSHSTFKEFFHQIEDVVEKAKKDAEKLVNNPNPDFANGFGQTTLIQDLAATINGIKPNCIIDDEPQNWSDPTTPLYWLMQKVHKNKIPTAKTGTRSIAIGKDAPELAVLINKNSQFNHPDYPEWQRIIGKMLGYKDSAVEAYIQRLKDIRSGKKVEDITELKKKKFN